MKLARSQETGDFVAIKIIQRFSKKRRLGRVTVSPEDKTKREIAILKKIRHPNVVGLIEVIDDPELKKIYMVLEHVELGEIIWRKKGVPQICLFERRRTEKEQRGEPDTGDEERFFKMIERRRRRKEAQRAKISQLQLSQTTADYWSLEHGEGDDDLESQSLSRQTTRESDHPSQLQNTRSNAGSHPDSKATSRAPSRAPSKSSSRAHTPLPEHDIPAIDSDNEVDTPGPLPSMSSNHGSMSALEGTYYGSYPDEAPRRGRSPSMADSIISHMSSADDAQHDAFEDDYSYVPCFTMDQARSAFRDTVLGLEYLHYEGIVHRDIKPGNLLWTKDHRVKISDFGVSYFGRPIREGEAEEIVSEGDATDFDDDLELAKTVGTPAFFAPELCYTDLDTEQPRVTEQIDVWSLGITLYCLIFARIPFLAEDEYQLFRCIAKNEVYIPRRRLKPIRPSGTPLGPSQPKLMDQSNDPYREDGELAFENIDDELYDLLRRMLMKDPLERVKLREVKRHPWVIRGIDNIMGWIDDTDPSRKTAGRRIQVDRAELDHAVIPISIIERARSAMKKAVGKVLSVTRSETRGEGTRKRAVSNAASSGKDSSVYPQSPATSISKDSRRGSLRIDESAFLPPFGDLYERREPGEHPLAQSSTAEDALSSDTFQQSSSVGASPARARSGTAGHFHRRPGPPNRNIPSTASVQTIVPKGHAHSRSVTNPPTAIATDGHPMTLGPFTARPFIGHDDGGHMPASRGRNLTAGFEDHWSIRARSVDRGIFGVENKHAEPSIAMCSAVVGGHVEAPNTPGQYAADAPCDKALPSPPFFQSRMVHEHQTAFPSAPMLTSHNDTASTLEGGPTTTTRPSQGKTPAPQVYRASTPQSFERAQESLERRRTIEAVEEKKRRELIELRAANNGPASFTPGPGGDAPIVKQEATRAPSSSSVNSSGFVTSPSDIASPLTLGSQGQLFASVPSLPALVSSSSSVVADPEGDFLQHPGVVSQSHDVLDPSVVAETAATSPRHSKHGSNETETPAVIDEPLSIDVDVDEEGYNGDGDTAFTIDDDVDSDSDEGLTMTRRKPHTTPPASAVRRGTGGSVGSTETTKAAVIDG